MKKISLVTYFLIFLTFVFSFSFSFSSKLQKEKFIALKFNSKVSGILPADKIYLTFIIQTNSEKLSEAKSLNEKLFKDLKTFYEKNFGIKTGIAKKTINKIIQKTGENIGKVFYRVDNLILSKSKNLQGAHLLIENLNSDYIKKMKVYYSFSKDRIKNCIDKITISAMRKARIKINKDLMIRNMKLAKIKNTKFSISSSNELKYGEKEQIEKFSNREDIKIFNIILTLEYYAKKLNVDDTIKESIYW